MQSAEKEKKEGELTKEDERKCKLFLTSTLFNVFQWVIIIQSEPTLISNLAKDKSRIGNLLGTTQGVAGALAFILYPFLGKVTDAIGRKPGLLLAPVSNAITGTLVTLNPHSLFLVLLNRILRMLTLSFSNTVMTRTAMSDFLSGSSLAVSFTKILAATGLATVVAPQAETAILKITKSPRSAYAAFTLTAILHSLFNFFVTPETLETAKRASLDTVLKLSNLNPFSAFMKLFTHGSGSLQKLSIIYGLQMFSEGKNTQDTTWTWMVEFLKWEVPTRNAFISLYGIEGITSGMFFAPTLIKQCGRRRFTTLANFCVAISGYLSFLIQNGFGFLIGAITLLPGINGVSGAAVSAMAGELASAEGFGKGEFAGIISNLRSLAGIACPVLMGRYISWLKVKGLHKYVGTAFLILPTLSAVLPELMHQTINYKQIEAKIAEAK